MQECAKPVDVISVFSADGSIRPLRLRVEDENRELLRIDIEQILSIKEIPYVGVEAQIFLCRGCANGSCKTFQLQYLFRKHSWLLTQIR